VREAANALRALLADFVGCWPCGLLAMLRMAAGTLRVLLTG